ncbi:PAS domain-containing sensor histidine kinase, partial [Leptospira sp. 201903075]|nr:PAS domain-containing sensor histidine kinase [Leptospira chreensis]
MFPFEMNVIFAVTVISVVFNTSMAIIIYYLSKHSRSEVKLAYTAFFLAVLVLRNLTLFLFGDSNQTLYFFFAETFSLISSYLLISAVLPILSKRISPTLIYISYYVIFIIFASLLLTDLSFLWKAMPSAMFHAGALLVFGLTVFRLNTYPKAFRFFFITVCLLLTLQRITFPHLFGLEWYRPLGYTINTLLMFLFGVGCILFNFNVQTNQLNLSLVELEVLQKTIKDVNVRLLIMYNQLPAIIYNIEFLPEPRTSYISPK